jgi:chromosome segregation ATPase
MKRILTKEELARLLKEAESNNEELRQRNAALQTRVREQETAIRHKDMQFVDTHREHDELRNRLREVQALLAVAQKTQQKERPGGPGLAVSFRSLPDLPGLAVALRSVPGGIHILVTDGRDDSE